MPTGAITEYIDVAQVSLYVFWLFFAGLIYLIRREDRREGYPLETDLTGRVGKKNSLLMAKPKEYKLPHGHGSYFAPNDKRDNTRDFKMKRVAPWPGSPYEPTGDPMEDGIGPAAWAERDDRPELTKNGEPAIVPMKTNSEYAVAKQDSDPRGMDVVACDGKAVAKVEDIWVDRSENNVRYLEAKLEGSSEPIMIPLNMLRIKGEKKKHVYVHALTSEHFPKIPKIKQKDQITVLEEEKIQSYFAGGKLYGKPSRMGPLV